MPKDSDKTRITTSEFVISNTDISRCPSDNLPEYAFIGRSNVGKSSLINMLCGRKNLALTSSKPGKTLLINHFIINKSWYLVDLPGYGYAKRSKKIIGKIGDIVERYVNERESLTCLFILVDARLEPQNIDIDFINHAGANGIPIAIVFTKADHPNSETVKRNIAAMKRTLEQYWEELPPIFVTSSQRKSGKEEILAYIAGINASLRKGKQ